MTQHTPGAEGTWGLKMFIFKGKLAWLTGTKGWGDTKKPDCTPISTENLRSWILFSPRAIKPPSQAWPKAGHGGGGSQMPGEWHRAGCRAARPFCTRKTTRPLSHTNDWRFCWHLRSVRHGTFLRAKKDLHAALAHVPAKEVAPFQGAIGSSTNDGLFLGAPQPPSTTACAGPPTGHPASSSSVTRPLPEVGVQCCEAGKEWMYSLNRLRRRRGGPSETGSVFFSFEERPSRTKDHTHKGRPRSKLGLWPRADRTGA